jgi:3-deoxy-D-manno-octulosonate 8-phosphate phosphatase (KDO 8-P phosphatase)
MSLHIFEEKGAIFPIGHDALTEKLKRVKTLVFDWDGIFNSGEKGEVPSSFNEVDSMGINMLRFGYYLHHGQMPVTCVVTGETNHTAFAWSKREHLDFVFYQSKKKADILPWLAERAAVEEESILFAYDDILDLSLAAVAGARMLVPHHASPLFTKYCLDKSLCDYVTFCGGRDSAIREISEVVLYALGRFEETIEKRSAMHEDYKAYLKLRNELTTEILKTTENGFISETSQAKIGF